MRVKTGQKKLKGVSNGSKGVKQGHKETYRYHRYIIDSCVRRYWVPFCSQQLKHPPSLLSSNVPMDQSQQTLNKFI